MNIEIQDILPKIIGDGNLDLGFDLHNMLLIADNHQNASGFTDNSAGDQASLRILWLMSHYISAASSSHGLRIGYIERTERDIFTKKAQTLSNILPTSLAIDVIYCDKSKVFTFICGGGLSDFEKTDLRFNVPDQGDGNMLGMILIRYDGIDDGYAERLNNIIINQKCLSHVFVIHETGTDWTPSGLTTEWSSINISGIGHGLDISVHSNGSWIERLSHLGLSIPYIYNANNNIPQSDAHIVQIVGINDFPAASKVNEFPAESLAGPVISIYELGKSGHITKSFGRRPNIVLGDHQLYDCRDVCVSQGGVIWRNDRALGESITGISCDTDTLTGNGIEVTEPVEELKGTYFLASTTNIHHSHLMWETLSKFHFAIPYQPGLKLLACSVLSKSQREYFKLFGFSDEDCVYRSNKKTYLVERLLCPAGGVQKYSRKSILHFQNIGMKYRNSSTPRAEKIYVSRKDSRVYRNLVNEDEIELVFKNFGFDVVVASELSAEQKIATFSNARYVAGALGAAFNYVSFSQGADQIILTSDLYTPDVYYEIGAMLTSPVHYIFGVGLQHYSLWKYAHSSFYIPPQMAICALQDIIGKN